MSNNSQETNNIKAWSAFSFRDFRLLWISGLCASVTMQTRILTFGVWLYQETGSGLQLGLLGLVQLAVQMPSNLFGGAFADQLDRRKLIASTQSFSFFLIGLATILFVTDNLHPWHIYSIVGILGLTSTLGAPARSALTANVIPSSHMMHAVTSNTATFQISMILTPLLFSSTIELIGLEGAFLTAVIFSVPATIFPLFVRLKYNIDGNKNTQNTSMIKRIYEGFKFVKNHPILPGLYALDIGVTVVSFYREIMPLIVDKLFRQGPWAIGPLSAANSLGGVAGSFLVLSLANYRSKGMLVLYATGTYALLLFAFGSIQYLDLNTIFILTVGSIIIAGLGATDAIGMTTRQTTVQLTTPDNMRGRAVSFHSFCAMGANNIGTFHVGFMSSRIGAGNTMILGGVVSICVVLAIFKFVSGLRNYRYP
ncbi:MAG: MFS transporter [SAR202 cluster bacterium]|nr:MFS transporter [SAR202 cluster bacterium]